MEKKKKDQKNIRKIKKKDLKNKHEKNIENYVMKKKLQKENMEEINIEIYTYIFFLTAQNLKLFG